jgi:D-serine dehydratase
MGMRDVSFDQGLPVAQRVFRAGEPLPPRNVRPEVTRLNDQHAFLKVAPEDDIAVGDVIEFGISHPCTCLDRYRVIFGLDPSGHVRNAFQTFFG